MLIGKPSECILHVQVISQLHILQKVHSYLYDIFFYNNYIYHSGTKFNQPQGYSLKGQTLHAYIQLHV